MWCEHTAVLNNTYKCSNKLLIFSVVCKSWSTNFFDDLKPKLFTNWFCFSKVRQNPKEGNFFVQNLKRVAVVDYADIERRIEEGKFEIQNIV